MKKSYKTLIIVQIVIILFIIVSFVLVKSGIVSLLPVCIYREKFGIICPACFGTTFAIELANFNFIRAFLVHPVFFISVIYLGLLDLVYIINVLFDKKINIFKWWHALIWIGILIIYTLIRNLI